MSLLCKRPCVVNANDRIICHTCHTLIRRVKLARMVSGTRRVASSFASDQLEGLEIKIRELDGVAVMLQPDRTARWHTGKFRVLDHLPAV